MTIIPIELGEKSYQIEMVADSWQGLADWLTSQSFSQQGLIVSDSNVGPLYGKTVQTLLEKAGICADIYCFQAGEAAKNLQEANAIFTKAIQEKLDRHSLLVALGGGVVGDMAGFVAATYLRGIPFIQIPTSLLAQVDSSVGGKVAVDHPLGKNLIGAFYQPRRVHINLAVLKTLEPRQFYAGMAEVIKYGLLADSTLFQYLEDHADALLALEPEAVGYVIQRCCEMKAEFVCADETEQGVRMALNLGHTMGHGIEAASSFSYLHGEAVAVGLLGTLYLSELTTGLSPTIAVRLKRLLQRYHLPTAAPGFKEDDILSYMSRDKKNLNQQTRWILLEDLGKWKISSAVEDSDVLAVLTRLVAVEA
ncbi:MAG: 3-dehydroquinate synthase [Sporomusaceae bacterium]|nr:3-dehydroquinate synthase [Sporomusaceae bacterium]